MSVPEDEMAPAHVRCEPDYVTELHLNAESIIKKSVTNVTAESLANKKDDDVITIPVWMLSWKEMQIPGNS